MKQAWSGFKSRASVMAGLVALLWAIEVINFLVGHGLNQYGLLPGTTRGIWGIFLSPFLHGSFSHLILNTVPLIVLGWLVIIRGVGTFLLVSLTIIALGGLGVWEFGRQAYHVGASGLIFGYFGYLVARGYFEKSPGAILVSVVVVLAYGGLVWGIFPNQPGVSWEGHGFGLLAGAVAAWLYRKPPEGNGARSN